MVQIIKKLKIITKIAPHAIIQYFIIRVVQIYLDFVFFTSYIKLKIDKKTIDILSSRTACFLTVWHGRMLIFPKIMKKYGVFNILTSLHRDGEYVDKFVKLYGHKTIRGSTFNGSLFATKMIIKCIKENKSVVITPDGPRGPKCKINSAIVNLAFKLQVPIISMSFSSSRVKILDSWDHFIIPLPFSKIFINISSPRFFNQTQNNHLGMMMRAQTKQLDKKMAYMKYNRS